MPTLQDRRDKRASLWDQYKAINDRTDYDPRGEDLEQRDRIEKDLDALDSVIENMEKEQKRDGTYNRTDRTGVLPPSGGDDRRDEAQNAYATAFSTFMRQGMDALDSDQRKLMRSHFQAPQNAAGVGTSAGGGYAVPPEFREQFVQVKKAYGNVAAEAENITTETGASMPWPVNDDTGNVGAILAENTQVSEQDVTLSTASINAYMYTSKLVRASLQILNDWNGFEGWLAGRLGERLGRITNAHFTTGTGTSQPLGLVTGATTGVTGTGSFASTGGISGDNLIDLIESLDDAYGASNNLKFMGHQSVRKAVRKIKDTTGAYMWQPGLTAGAPNTLLGFPFVVNNDMATLAASSKSLLFGDFREAYLVRTVQGVTTMRLTERYADFLQVGFLLFERQDGTVQNANAYRAFATTVTA
jgi:HK97 family phage major capsid protein